MEGGEELEDQRRERWGGGNEPTADGLWFGAGAGASAGMIGEWDGGLVGYGGA